MQCSFFNLDQLHDKDARYKSFKNFLTKGVTEKVISNGLQIELEPNIGITTICHCMS